MFSADGTRGRARHGHDLTADRHNKTGARDQAHFAHRKSEPGRRAAQVRVGRKAVLRFRHTDRQVAIALLFPQPSAGQDLLDPSRFIGAVDPWQWSDLVGQRHVIRIDRRKVAYPVRRFSNFGRQICRPFGPSLPVRDRIASDPARRRSPLTACTSASVSVTKWLIATTTGTPKDFMFSM